jgi:hypothetical protein
LKENTVHKSTKEILSRRAPPSNVYVEDKGEDGIILWVGDESGRETHAVNVSEHHRTFVLGREQIVAPGQDKYRIRDWREVLYADAIHALMKYSGRYRAPSVCVILGQDAVANQNCLKSAIRFGLPRMTVIGERQADLMEPYEIGIEIEYLPTNSPRPNGTNQVVIDANAMAAACPTL